MLLLQVASLENGHWTLKDEFARDRNSGSGGNSSGGGGRAL